jgi:hypothetical protein
VVLVALAKAVSAGYKRDEAFASAAGTTAAWKAVAVAGASAGATEMAIVYTQL